MRQKAAAPLTLAVEAVEKVPKQILGRNAGKSDLIECATINDLMLGKDQVTLEHTVLTRQKDFSYRLVKRKDEKPKIIQGTRTLILFSLSR
jgi:hypothetical protein